jgi:glycosyltransferase involved in cell wall biosynthesis
VLPLLLTRLNALADTHTKYNFEFLFVNDGSRDRTFEILCKEAKRNPRIAYINLSRNFGKEIAMKAGLDRARGDALVVIDADLQDPPELIPEMIEYWEKGYQDVYARRKSRAGESWLKKWTSERYYRFLQRVAGTEIQKDTGDFRLLDKKCIDALREIKEASRNTKALFSWIGYKKKEILYDRDERLAGATKWSYPKLINLALDGITSFTIMPLRIASFIGALVSAFAVVYGAIILFNAVFGKVSTPGYASTMVAILFLGGIQLLSIGIIGEYLGRVFLETKNRPLYFVNDEHFGKIGDEEQV